MNKSLLLTPELVQTYCEQLISEHPVVLNDGLKAVLEDFGDRVRREVFNRRLDRPELKKEMLKIATSCIDSEWHSDDYPVMAVVLVDQILELIPTEESVREDEKKRIAKVIEDVLPTTTRFGALSYLRDLVKALKGTYHRGGVSRE